MTDNDHKSQRCFRQTGFLFCLLLTLQLQAQPPTPVRNIVFEGAGMRGIAYCGVIRALEENRLIDSVQRIGGTSAGAIIALMVSLGYHYDEIEQLIGTTSFKNLNDGQYFFFGGIHRIKKYYGWYRGERFTKWISRIIEAKTGDPDITFAQLHRQGLKDLYITGTDLTSQQPVIFSREFYPRMKVKDAVRISVSIPLYFRALFVDSAGTLYTRPKAGQDLHVMVDGGFVANYPIRIFDSTRYLGEETNRFAVNAATIGFRIDSKAQIENDRQGKGLATMKITRLPEYITAFYTIILENLNRQTLTDEDWKRTVSIDDGMIGPRIRKLSAGEIERLTLNGYQAASGFLHTGNGLQQPKSLPAPISPH